MDRDVKCSIKEKKIEKPKTDMQGHPAHSPTIIIPRTFRWTLTNENHPDIHWWMKSLKTDYVSKKIIIDVFDDAKGAVFNWIQALVDADKTANTIVLTHLDGCGDAISLISFVGLKIEDHMTHYDYGSSEVLTHKVIIAYNKVKRTNQLNVV
jgi:hypothetical protein